MWSAIVFLLLFLTPLIIAKRSWKHGDFVEKVVCHATGMDITLTEVLPIPRGGMWDLEVENYPKCPGGATKTNVGGSYTFTILYSDSKLCGTEPKSFFTPSWVSTAQTTLLLKDGNGTKIADSISCVYNTRFDASLLTFSGQVKSENLLYGGSLDEDGADIEATVDSGNSILMDFFDQSGQQLQQRSVKLGDPIMFRINVAENKQVSKVLPELCYFSSSPDAIESPAEGQTLTFVKNSCFQDQNGMVKAFLPKMEKNGNGTTFEMPFPAFYFTEFGQSLFVHCTILACVGNQKLCDPKPACFGSDRRKRSVNQLESAHNSFDSAMAKELIMTKFIIVEDKRKAKSTPELPTLEQTFAQGTVCMQTAHFSALIGILLTASVVLLVVVSCMSGRLARVHNQPDRDQLDLQRQTARYHLPPAYFTTKPAEMPIVTSF